MSESEKYIEYLENEMLIMREYLDVLDVYNSGSVADDVTDLLDELINT